MLYRLMWDCLKESAETMVKTGKMLKVDDDKNTVRWGALLEMMDSDGAVCDGEDSICGLILLF